MTEDLSFELAMERLEEIVKKLETGEAALDSSISLFEEGTRLSAYLNNLLDQAEQKITIVTRHESSLQEAPFQVKE